MYVYVYSQLKKYPLAKKAWQQQQWFSSGNLNFCGKSATFGTMLLLLQSLIMFILCTDAETVKN